MELILKLFENAAYYADEYRRLQHALGEFDTLTQMQYAKFHALYSLIKDAGMERTTGKER